MEVFGLANKLIRQVIYVAILGGINFIPWSVTAQKASIAEEIKMLKTYPFGDPNPIPILTDNTKIYPYFKFEGYSHTGKPLPWKVITLENQYIQVFVLPEAGGKVWGAIDKSSGKEFIYRNEVMKHRNISMRGPWTSGGIEFNFGIIGHHPSTATPVDYLIQENEDGSVSCIVGNIDLSSRTHWRVKITLPNDKAYFETTAMWYNPTPMHQSYYNWMTAAAFAREDLEFFTPGNQYVKHSGEAMPWPYDAENRKISQYKNNNYGPSKSYHVVGEYNDFFGGYYHDEQFGFGHWSLYEEVPGQKLWLWALSRAGDIWTDLLTDTDGQYIEFQAGRLFDQYSPGDHINPITQATFAPYSTDTWRELWFPFNQIGGMSDVSPMGVLHVSENGQSLQIGINALSQSSGNLVVKQNGNTIHQESLQLKPAQTFTKEINLAHAGSWEVSVEEMDLHYSSNPEVNQLKRPFEYPEVSEINPAEQFYVEGMELMEFREYDQAREKFEQCLKLDGANQRALNALGELHFRKAEYQTAINYIHKALAMDTYNPASNYIAGIIYRAQGDLVNALESLGWAARSMEFRSAAYAQMAEISLQRNELDLAEVYAKKSLDFNRYNVSAYQVLAIAARMKEDKATAQETLATLLEIDPLNHFGHYEQALWDNKIQFESFVRSEFPQQTYMELAIDYFNKGMKPQAIDLFSKIPDYPIANIWLAYLSQEHDQTWQAHLSQALQQSVDFVFPYRRETIPILEWAQAQDEHWKLKYYLALNYWGKDRTQEAAQLFETCGQRPEYAAFYLARADLLKKILGQDEYNDLQHALALAPTNWRAYSALIKYHHQTNSYKEALILAGKAYKKFPDNYDLGMSYAKAQLYANQYKQCIQTLKSIQVLPFEGASEGRQIYEQAHLSLALEMMEKKKYEAAIAILKDALEWPENLGVGKPYDPDNRPQDFLLAYCYDKLNRSSDQKEHLNLAIVYTKKFYAENHPNNLLGLLSLRDTGNESEANALLQSLTGSPESNPANVWVKMKYQKSKSEHPTLNQETYSSLSYQILNRIYNLIN